MPPSVIEIVEWPHPKIHIAVDKTFLDNVKCARDPPIEILDDDNQVTPESENRQSEKRPPTSQRDTSKPAKKARVTFAETITSSSSSSSSSSMTKANTNSSVTKANTNSSVAKAKTSNNVAKAKTSSSVTKAKTSSSVKKTNASSSNSTPATSTNIYKWSIVELGPVPHAHQSGPPRMPGGVDEYAGRKTVKEWLQAESKYKKDVKQTRVPVYKSGDRQIARIGAEEADIDLTPEGKQHGAPIGKLPDQLLSLIFQQCSHIQTLSTVVTVCRQWRRAGLDPFVWRHVSAEQMSLFEQIVQCGKSDKRPLARRLQHTVSITLDTIIYASCRIHSLPKNARTIFPRLKEVYATWHHYEDLLRFITWIPGLEVIWADRIKVMSRHQQMLIFSEFKKHQKTLKKLSMRFSEGCPVEGYLDESPDEPNVLPRTLEVLELVNIYDPDEEDHMKHLRKVQEKITMEDQRSGYAQLQGSLNTKYRSIGQLHNLRALTFGRCNAWTAEIWRKCLLPCAPKLEFLSLAGWDSRGRIQDTPDERLQARENLPGEPPISLAERAIADSIARMSKIRRIQLVKFYIGHGIVQGVKRLLHNNDGDLEIEAVYVNGKKARSGMARLEALEGTSTDLEIYFQ